MINKPTRVTRTTTTLIDNIFTNKVFDCETINGLFFTRISDHFPIFSVSMNAKCRAPRFYKIRTYSPENLEKFKDALAKTDWSEMRIVF